MNKLNEIIATLEQLALLGEIHKENPFKIRAYTNAARILNKLGDQFDKFYNNGQIKNVKGIGPGIYEIIEQVMQNKKVLALTKLLHETPSGLLELLKLPGIGAKKVRILWQELDITSLGELEYACKENRLMSLTGFGAKTQTNILTALTILHEQAGLFRLDDGYQTAQSLIKIFATNNNLSKCYLTGEVANGAETLSLIELEVVSKLSAIELEKQIDNILSDAKYDKKQNSILGTFKGLPVKINLNTQKSAKPKIFPKLITRSDLLGAFHNHTTASDGINSIEEMRSSAIMRNLKYLGISDHSKSAFYAKGLKPEELLDQCQFIAHLNKDSTAKNCFLLSGIESDILASGELDYDDSTLNHLNLIIASVHSRLKQDAKQMTERLCNAASNPWTDIIGHPTGRLILGRSPSQFDMELFLTCCKNNDTAVELNANPQRLDLNAEHLALAKEIGVKITINADAHSTAGLNDLEYGIMTARRAGLTAEDVLNCHELKYVLEWLRKRKERARKLSGLNV